MCHDITSHVTLDWILFNHMHVLGLPRWHNSKEFTCNVGDTGVSDSTPGLGRYFGGRHGNPLSILARKSPWTEEGYSSWGHKKSDTNEWLSTNARDVRDTVLIAGSGRSPGEGNGNPLQYSCLEKSHGQRLAGYSPGDCKEPNTT